MESLAGAGFEGDRELRAVRHVPLIGTRNRVAGVAKGDLGARNKLPRYTWIRPERHTNSGGVDHNRSPVAHGESPITPDTVERGDQPYSRDGMILR